MQTNELIETLRKRIAQFDQEEKQAWANLNFVMGARAECAHVLEELEKQPGTLKLIEKDEPTESTG